MRRPGSGFGTTVTLGHEPLAVADVAAVARHGARVSLSDDPAVMGRALRAQRLLERWADEGAPIYGVTTPFGALADTVLSKEEGIRLQNRAVQAHKTGLGRPLPADCVRAAMLLRLNSHLKGHSGVRETLMRRLETFLNEGITPRVREFGSIGASGDLVPLNYVCGCIIGRAGFEVEFRGEVVAATDALARVGLEPIELATREGLAMMNGTSMSAGTAALLFEDARRLLGGTLAFHALAFQSLAASVEPLHPFIHRLKPHPGQLWTARSLRRLLQGSAFTGAAAVQGSGPGHRKLIQDRYSLRCAPQFLGPLIEDLALGEERVLMDANGCSDNPLIDVDHETVHHGGNFLGLYVSRSVDTLRWCLGMMAKHIDVQLALIMSPEFSGGLSASLIGNTADPSNIGLKGVQLTANSLVPLLLHGGTGLADRFPTYAEQHNQNLNSQSLGACLLGLESTRQYRALLAVALLVTVQALDLRSQRLFGSYDPRPHLAPAGRSLYELLRALMDSAPRQDRPLVWNDGEHDLGVSLERIDDALRENAALGEEIDSLFPGASLSDVTAAC